MSVWLPVRGTFAAVLACSCACRAADQICADPAATPPASGVCSVTSGDAARLLRGTVLLPGGIAMNGSVLVTSDGDIACAGCGCQSVTGADTATRIDCADGVISPGLIDLRNYLNYSGNGPVPDTGERYEHRHEWRLGLNAHTEISLGGAATTAQIQWAELRALIAGVTSATSSGSAANLLRNLSSASRLDGLTGATAALATFPLSDMDGTELSSGCAYPSLPSAPGGGSRYEFVAAEGIGVEARNEFLCLSGLQEGGVDVLGNASVVAAIPLRAGDAQAVADHSASVVWEPRSDLRLYGVTTPVTLFDNLGINIALGTVWTPTGSTQLQRELACADSYNATYLHGHFSSHALWRMATANAATAAGFDAEIGRLEAGMKGDVVVFDGRTRSGYRSAVGADPGDVVLVLKGGVPMYGEAIVVAALGGGDGVCDQLDVCGNERRLCVTREIGISISTLAATVGAVQPLFECGTPVNEPTCKPQRAGGNVEPLFSGDPTTGDADGDGVADAVDICPQIFDPPLPANGLVQLDSDDDGFGDACDACPLDSTNACDRLFSNGFELPMAATLAEET